jgi:imidazoleglycerol-phosphate dehydratase/histidinol-phosphatase
MRARCVVFVDRDGTIIREPPDKQIDSLEKLEFVPGILGGLRMLADAGFRLLMVTNQDGLGTAAYPRAAFDLVQKRVLRTLKGEGIRFDRIFICPHRPEDGCACRKPRTRLVERYLRVSPMDPACSFVLGDRETDVAFARNLGIRAARLARPRTRTAADFATPDAHAACAWIVRAAECLTPARGVR